MGACNCLRDVERSSHRVIFNAPFPTVSFLLLVLWLAATAKAGAQCTGCAEYGPSRMWTSNTTPALTDASGLAASTKNPGVLWTHNDSGGDEPLVYAISTNGPLLGSFDIGADTLADFDDIAIGPGPIAGTPYLYLGDIGVGGLGTATRSSVRIFRVPEPDLNSGVAHGARVTVLAPVERFTLTYPDGGYDAEAMMVDPVTGDLFIGAKQLGATRIYRASLAGAQDGATIRLELVATTTLNGASAGTISADGSRIVLRNERNARLWFRCPGESVGSAMARSAVAIPLVGKLYETNGEAIAFLPDGSGYVTLSDSVVSPPLFFFPLNCSSNGLPPLTNNLPAAPLPPAITQIITQPQGAVVEPGASVQLKVVAVGQNLHYEWRRDGVSLPGANTDTLLLPDIQPDQSGNYSVAVIGDHGSMISESAPVAVRSLAPEPVILVAPESTYVVRGGSKNLAVYASGAEPLTYSWSRNGRPLPATGPVLSLRNAKGASAGTYHVTVSNDYGTADADADVQVLPGPTVRVTPAKRTVRTGATVVFRAVARGARPREFWWFFNNELIAGENGPKLVLRGVDESSAGLYEARVVTPAGFAGAGATLKVH